MNESDAIVRPAQFPEPTVEIPLPWSAASANEVTAPLAAPAPAPIPTRTMAMPAAAPIPAHTMVMPARAPVTPEAPNHPGVTGWGVIAFANNRPRWRLPSQLVVLVLVVAASGFFGYSGYRSVAGVGLSESGWSQVAGWSWALLFAAVATLVVAVVSVVVLIRTQVSRLIAVISLIVAVLLPPIALYAGGRLGFDIAAASVHNDLESSDSWGFIAALFTWLMRVIGG